MMKVYKILIAIVIILSNCLLSARVVPFITTRSQSENSVRELVLWQTHINLFDQEEVNGCFSIMPGYARTFKPNEIAQALFGNVLVRDCNNNKCPHFLVQGSAVTDRDSNALFAEYFGLPMDYSSVVNISPCISTVLVDFNLFLGLDQWAEGLFFRIHAPLVHTKWDLGFCEQDVDAGVQNYPLGYFNGSVANPDDPAAQHYGVAHSHLTKTFEQFVSYRQVPTISGILFQSLEKARMARCGVEDTALSDIQVAFGWNFARDEHYHVGLSIRAAMPTGTRPQGQWLFEPIVGNGKHWEIGAGFTSHWTAWRSDDGCDEFGMYIDANVTHLIKARQCRTFDVCGKPLSRYMLASKMTTPVRNLQDTAGNAPSYQFADEFCPVANISTIPVDDMIAVQADLVLKFAYIHKNFQFDFGYNVWGRTCEKITPRTPTCFSGVTNWVLKGDSFVYGFANDGSATPVPLSVSESNATIACGTNDSNRSDALVWYANPGVDNAKCAFDSAANNIQNLVGGVAEPMFSSFDPLVFDTRETAQWDIKGAQTSGLSQKVFINFGYSWTECCDRVIPYLGIGAEVEFGTIDYDCNCDTALSCITGVPAVTDCGAVTRNGCSTCCTSSSSSSSTCCNGCSQACGCMSVTPSQWGVWLKGGIAFES